MKSLIIAVAVPFLVAAMPTSATPNTTITVDTNSPIDDLVDTAQPTPSSLPPAEIVGGYTAKPGEFPSTVALLFAGYLLCGATLIDANTALTAAHCVDYPGVYTVLAGSSNIQEGRENGILSSSTEVILHSGWNSSIVDNDFAIIKLATPIPERSGTGAIKYAKLPRRGSDPIPGTKMVASGWGALSQWGANSADLQAVKLPVVHRKTCAKQNAPLLVTDNMFCAGYRKGGKDTCQGDSGGPLYRSSNGELAGVVSWGSGCAAPNSPGVYARVSAAISFIREHSG